MLVYVMHYRLDAPIMKILNGGKNSLYAFGYNSTESAPIWIKIWNIVSQMLGASPGRLWMRSAQ